MSKKRQWSVGGGKLAEGLERRRAAEFIAQMGWGKEGQGGGGGGVSGYQEKETGREGRKGGSVALHRYTKMHRGQRGAWEN